MYIQITLHITEGMQYGSTCSIKHTAFIIIITVKRNFYYGHNLVILAALSFWKIAHFLPLTQSTILWRRLNIL